MGRPTDVNQDRTRTLQKNRRNTQRRKNFFFDQRAATEEECGAKLWYLPPTKTIDAGVGRQVKQQLGLLLDEMLDRDEDDGAQHKIVDLDDQVCKRGMGKILDEEGLTHVEIL